MKDTCNDTSNNTQMLLSLQVHEENEKNHCEQKLHSMSKVAEQKGIVCALPADAFMHSRVPGLVSLGYC